jgi:hypothetical protein
MTAADLADLNGLLARIVTARVQAGDRRNKERIAAAVLRQCDAPDIKPTLQRLTGLCAWLNAQPKAANDNAPPDAA